MPDDIGQPEDSSILAGPVKEEHNDEEQEQQEEKRLGAQIYIVPEKGMKKSSRNIGQKEDTTLEKQHE